VNGRVLIVLGVGVLAALLVLILAQSYAGRVALVDSQRGGCERSKLDRKNNADGWTAHAAYIDNVTRAASVQEDVKRAARTAVTTYERVSRDLRRRSHIDCADVFPAPSLMP
jgi:hypothetical protein